MKFGEVPKLNKTQRFLLSVTGKAFLRYEQPPGYVSWVIIYVVKCPKHGLYLDTPHGFDDHFQCSDCLAETVREGNR